ncbi:methyltransferase domain-containing protein [bacterium]|nr:MAG: methyltransferase domain-containing protein [bacterium]
MAVFKYASREVSRRSAQIMVPYIVEVTKARSVIDVGCGLGSWLLAYLENGLDIKGLDNCHVLTEDTLVDKAVVQVVNFEKGYPKLEKADLVNCLEVAEHIDPSAADGFLDFLVGLSDVIVFSAAFPGQGGFEHKNEQYPQYWRDRFAARGYVFLDAFRPVFWQNSEIALWYRQNMFLVVKKEIASRFAIPVWDGNVYILPEMYEAKIRKIEELKGKRLSRKLKKVFGFFR